MPAGPGEGILVIDRPWPSMMRTLRGDHERFEKTYFPTGEGFAGKYFTGESPAHSLYTAMQLSGTMRRKRC